MSNHSATIHTLRADGYNSIVDKGFMHVDCDNGYIGVHTISQLPTFLVAKDIVIQLIQFNSDNWAKDWITYHQKYIDWIKRVRYDNVLNTVALEHEQLSDWIIPRDDFCWPGILGEDDGIPTIAERLAELAVGLRKTGDEGNIEVANDIVDIVRSM